MPGSSCDIDKLLREIQGAGQYRDAADQGQRTANATAQASRNRHTMPFSADTHYAISSRTLLDHRQQHRHMTDIEDEEAPLDAFGIHLYPSNRVRQLTGRQIKLYLMSLKDLHSDSISLASIGKPG